MIDTGKAIEFIKTSSKKYKGLMNPSEDNIYFCEDTKQIFIGNIEYTRPLIIRSGSPYDNKISPKSYNGTLYYDTEDKKLYTSNSINWLLLDVTSSIEDVNIISNEHIESLFSSESGTLLDQISSLV